jgi:ribosome-binding factor A
MNTHHHHEIENPDFAGRTERQVKVGLTVRNIAQDFFQRESSGASLITVTRAEISRDLKNTDIYITVLPESKEEQALSFAKRMRTDLRTEIKKKLHIRTVPTSSQVWHNKIKTADKFIS